MRAADQSCEREVLLLRFDVPKRVLDSRARHLMAANCGEDARNFRGATEVFAENQRTQKSANHKPGCFRSLRIEERAFRCSDFSPAGNSVGQELDEDDGAIAGYAKASFKGRFEAHLELAKSDGLNMHGSRVCKRASATNVSIRSRLPFATIGERTKYVKRLNTACFWLRQPKTARAVERSGVVPAGALALFLRNILCQSECLRAAIMANCGQERIDQSGWRGVRGAERSAFDGSQEDLVALPRQRRNICIRNAHAMGSTGPGLVRALYGLPQTAAEANRNNEIFLIDGPNDMQDSARGGGGKNRQPEQTDLIFEVVGKTDGEIASQKHDAARVIEAFRQRHKAAGIQTML